jgi:hypothetical protein
MIVTALIFMKLILIRQIFIQNSYIVFHENQTKTLEDDLIPSIPLCYDDYFINMTVKHNNLLNPIMGCLYVNFVGLHVSVIHMTIIRSVLRT